MFRNINANTEKKNKEMKEVVIGYSPSAMFNNLDSKRQNHQPDINKLLEIISVYEKSVDTTAKLKKTYPNMLAIYKVDKISLEFDSVKQSTTWLGILGSLHMNLLNAAKYNDTQYCLAVRALEVEILSSLQGREILEDKKNQLRKKLESKQDERWNLHGLVAMGDKDALHKAAKEGLLDKFLKPQAKTTLNSTIIDSELPWIFQDNFNEIYAYYLENKNLPTSIDDFVAWHDKENLEKASRIRSYSYGR